jgi:membrane protein DedA with SNARE-associated domain/rhodanese-related sulfurtransferase
VESFLQLFAHHGLLAVFGLVLAKQLGAPVPAFPFLLLAGAAAAGNGVFAAKALATATLASTMGDFVWFFAGRLYGRRVLTLLCRLSISQDSCVRKNELSFQRRGGTTLVLAKFVPGLGTVAPPLAGALGLPARSFAAFNLAGSALWAGTGIAAGLIFHAQIRPVLEALSGLGQAAVWLLVGAIAAYVTWRVVRRHREQRERRSIPQLTADELAEMLRSGTAPVILDVRARSETLPPPAHIPGSRHLDLSAIESARIPEWPQDVRVVTYCDCPNDATASKAAGLLSRQGIRASVLRGGIEGWLAAGHSVADLAAIAAEMPRPAVLVPKPPAATFR